jgi:F-type H+-transporting ATPase subunit alpha
MSVVQELLQKIQSQIDSKNLADTWDEKGEVIEVKDGVATISGLSKAKFSEIIAFECGLQGLVLDLDTTTV